MEIIGLSGYARSGKDEAAKVLVEKFGFKRVAFADKLRECLYQLNPIVAPSKELYFTRSKAVVDLKEVIDVYGWDGYKETEYGPEIRRLAQRMGTEVGRQTLFDSIWVDAALTGHRNDAKIVVTDCRFPNEAKAVMLASGLVVRVERPGIKPVNPHISETSLDEWPFDYTLDNDGSVEDWHQEVSDWYEHVVSRGFVGA